MICGGYRIRCWITCMISGGYRIRCWITCRISGGYRMRCWITCRISGGYRIRCWITCRISGGYRIRCWITCMISGGYRIRYALMCSSKPSLYRHASSRVPITPPQHTRCPPSRLHILTHPFIHTTTSAHTLSSLPPPYIDSPIHSYHHLSTHAVLPPASIY